MENMHSDVREYRVKRYFKELFRFFKASSSKKVSSTELDFRGKNLPLEGYFIEFHSNSALLYNVLCEVCETADRC